MAGQRPIPCHQCSMSQLGKTFIALQKPVFLKSELTKSQSPFKK